MANKDFDQVFKYKSIFREGITVLKIIPTPKNSNILQNRKKLKSYINVKELLKWNHSQIEKQ